VDLQSGVWFLDAASGQSLTIVPVQTRSELLALWDLDVAAYGEDVLPWERLARWHRAFATGLQMLVDGAGDVLGGVGIWPLYRDSYERLLRGELAEIELAMVDIDATMSSGYWYLSGVVVRADVRRRGFGRALMRVASQLAAGDEIGALVISPQGRGLLETLGFAGGDEREGVRVYTVRA